MRAATALLLAVASGGLAVAIVTADLAWTLTARLETFTAAGAWETVATVPYEERSYAKPVPVDGGGCATLRLRLIVDNHRPLRGEVSIRITYWNVSSQREVTVLSDRWALASFEARAYEFTIPAEAANRTPPAPEATPYVDPYFRVSAYVGENLLSTCLERPSASKTEAP